MDDKTKKLIKERFDALPESIQEVITSSNYQDTLIEIGGRYSLNVEQLGSLELETTLVMMGMTPLADFETELTREVNVDKEKGTQIFKEVNEKVFLKIRELLKLMNTGELDEPLAEKNAEETQIKINRIDSIMPKPETSATTDTEEEKQKNEQVLKEHGIEIIPEKLELAGVPVKPSILAQKISTPVQMPIVKTEHSLENITKVNAPTPNTGFTKPTIDPYREIPE
jgi:hypothetical protein